MVGSSARQRASRRILKDGLSRAAVWLGAMIFVILCALPVSLVAQDDASAPDAIPEQDTGLEGVASVAPVIVDGETLFVLRGFSALPAEERANATAQRIVDIAELEGEQGISVDIRVHEFGLEVAANGRMMTVTTQADADFEQIELEVLAELHREAIEQAIANYLEARSSSARIESAVAAIAWTLVVSVLSYLFFKKRRQAVERVERFTMDRFMQVEEATKDLVKGQAVAKLVGFLVLLFFWVSYLIILYYFLSLVLLSFAETRTFAEILLKYVSEPLFNIAIGFVRYLPDLITLAIIAIVTAYLIRGLELFKDNIEAGTFELRDFEPHWVTPTFNIARVVLIAIALVFAYPHIPGSDSRAFQGLTIIAGVMISLGSNTVVSNLVAGLFVIYRRSTNLGDRIKVGDQIGDVVEIKMMETLIKSVKNEMISIPNAQLLNSEVINYTRGIDGRGLTLHTTVGIGYEEPRAKVEAMLVAAALRTSGLKKSPEPFVLVTGLADFAVNYQINAFTTRGSRLPKLLSELHCNILDVFNENGVQIMTPSYEADPEVAKIPAEPWDGVLAAQSEKT